MDTLPNLSPPINRHAKPTLRDLMRAKGPAWAADYIVRRHGVRHRHAVLVVGMLGIVDREVRS